MASEKAKPETAERKERLASALRANLKRRKAQARGRASSSDGEEGPDQVDSTRPPPEHGEPGKSED